MIDQLIVSEPGMAATTAAIRELVDTEDITKGGIGSDNRDGDTKVGADE